jgi:hypothetical protein
MPPKDVLPASKKIPGLQPHRILLPYVWNGMYLAESDIHEVHPTDSAASVPGVSPGDRGAYVYVMSPHSGTQSRWYWRADLVRDARFGSKMAKQIHPVAGNRPARWATLDAAVAQATGWTVLADAAEGDLTKGEAGLTLAEMRRGRCYLVKGGDILRFVGPWSDRPGSHLAFRDPYLPLLQDGSLSGASIAQADVLTEIVASDFPWLTERIQQAMVRGLPGAALSASLALSEALLRAVLPEVSQDPTS